MGRGKFESGRRAGREYGVPRRGVVSFSSRICGGSVFNGRGEQRRLFSSREDQFVPGDHGSAGGWISQPRVARRASGLGRHAAGRASARGGRRCAQLRCAGAGLRWVESDRAGGAAVSGGHGVAGSGAFSSGKTHPDGGGVGRREQRCDQCVTRAQRAGRSAFDSRAARGAGGAGGLRLRAVHGGRTGGDARAWRAGERVA